MLLSLCALIAALATVAFRIAVIPGNNVGCR